MPSFAFSPAPPLLSSTFVETRSVCARRPRHAQVAISASLRPDAPEPQSALTVLRRACKHAAAASVLALALLVPGGAALAAKTGGRIGGSRFRAPSRSHHSAPRRSRSSPSRHAPSRHAPSRSYSAPQGIYMAPSRLYVLPSLMRRHDIGERDVDSEPSQSGSAATAPLEEDHDEGTHAEDKEFSIGGGTGKSPVENSTKRFATPRTSVDNKAVADDDRLTRYAFYGFLLTMSLGAFALAWGANDKRFAVGKSTGNGLPTAIAIVKVGMLASARKVQADLDALARSADTSSDPGLAFVLGETVTALLRKKDFWTHGAGALQTLKLSEAEAAFAETCLNERIKAEEETLTNTSGRFVETQSPSSSAPDKMPAERIVVSVVVATLGDFASRFPVKIESHADMAQALRALATVSGEDVQGVEVLWAPQNADDTLSEEEMLSDHPELSRL